MLEVIQFIMTVIVVDGIFDMLFNPVVAEVITTVPVES